MTGMAYPRQFLSESNFMLAFTRLVRSGNKEYKHYYRHLLQAYGLALEKNLADLRAAIRDGRFRPSRPLVVYQPKKSLILRPLTLLSVTDLIVYQAIANVIAEKFFEEQQRHALKKSFGAIFSGPDSPFFYRSWKKCYAAYNSAIKRSFDAGLHYVADFDLVSFFELIDHQLLRNALAKKVKSAELLDLLFECLERWTTDSAGAHVRHGVPQGPEPSAFLAECFLAHFDAKHFKDVRYLRYVDDIKLMSREEVPARRALLRLDLLSKEVGLVPQAQKIELRKVADVGEILKSVPSALASAREDLKDSASQRELLKHLRESLVWRGKQWLVEDVTRFKFSLLRLNPRKDVLKRIAPLLVRRPDLSWVLASYLRRFERREDAADVLLAALKQDPTYDAAAANYIDAMDRCEPPSPTASYRRAIQTVGRRSEENSIVLRVASNAFRGKRRSPVEAARLIEREPDRRAKGLLLHRLFGDAPEAPFKAADCVSLLSAGTEDTDADYARYCAVLLLAVWPWRAGGASWRPSRSANRSVKLLLTGLGMRARAPCAQGVLDTFFRDRMRIGIPMPWRRALGSDWRDVERRCLRLQKLLVGDPSARVLMLDTFNEVLVQRFSQRHPALVAAYKAAAHTRPHPDYGAWLGQPHPAAVLPRSIVWFRRVHDARVKADLAHAKMKSGAMRGRPTRPISHKQADSILRGAQGGWAELLREWRAIL
ncbi:MAG: hypothetical protein KC492_07775 [Myxococcales bacterium]|nr:hypothetical protein [Myxococcales bacterium]